MSMSISERSLFLERTAQIFECHRRWARSIGKILHYHLEEFRTFIESRLADRHCPYCRAVLRPADFRLEHKVPINRQGRFQLKNLVVCCVACQKAKSVLDDTEFRDMLAVLSTWPKPVERHFLARLRAGTGAVSGELPPVGSLEWFTGSAPTPSPAAEPGHESTNA